MTTPSPTPEAVLIEEARKKAVPSKSIRQAAKDAGISESRWRQIAKGYTAVTAGVQIPAVAPADTLASMALAVGVTPRQLRSVERSDAARILEAIQGARDGWDGDLSAVPDDELIAELDRRLRDRLGDTSPPQLRAVARRVDPADRSTFEGD